MGVLFNRCWCVQSFLQAPGSSHSLCSRTVSRKHLIQVSSTSQTTQLKISFTSERIMLALAPTANTSWYVIKPSKITEK